MRLRTEYAVGEIPHAEHPTPQRMRKAWRCLNGTWALRKYAADGTENFTGNILVPFSPETLLSGLKDGFSLGKGERLEYERTFTLTEEEAKKRVVLHFGAVDSECEVFVNGQKVGGHRGGFTAFSMELNGQIAAGENTLVVSVTDEATRNGGTRGKQSDRAGGIWYTPQSGIWQTVWLEFKPERSIENLRITPYVPEKKLVLEFACQDSVEIVVFDQGKEILRGKGRGRVEFVYDFELWSPENPKLYDLLLVSDGGDELYSYFGFRSFGLVTDKTGKQRLALNGKPYFYNGVLDQGYWSDGLLTYPSDQAAFDELKMLKDMGFNTVRKHIKVEPMRWYYHCDRLGLVVWQDFVNGGGEYKFTHVALLPFLGFHHKDDDYRYFAREDERAKQEFRDMAAEIVTALYNCVSVGVYVPFNEGWGQFDSGEMTRWLEEIDPTRIVDSVSGWHDQGEAETRLKSLHTYYTPLRVPKDSRAVVLSEFGGYAMKLDGHVFNPN
ncbi:MAG: glycoside hydrolase family 2, partial [Clostridia bacterium]|nr:glycoside hydrolase family 2 [Clostridia bacterium]